MNAEGGWTSHGGQILRLRVPIVLVPSLGAGMVLPLLMKLAGRRDMDSSGPVLGRVLAINTAGSIAGSLAAALVLPSLLGLWSSVVLCGATMCFAGGWSWGRLVQPGRFGAAAWVVCTIAAPAPVLLNPTRLPRTRISVEAGESLISIAEETQGIVAVVEVNGSKHIKLDNYYVLGGTASTGDERMQGHLPLLLHPAPKRVAFLGLGTGITASAALFHTIDRITAIEIVPEVVQAARDSFADANFGVVTAPRVEVIVEDARNVLQRTDRPALALIGHIDSVPLDPSTIAQNVQKTRRDPANPHLVHAAGVWLYFLGALDPVSYRFQQAKRNQENQPWIELLGPLAHAGSKRGRHPLFVGPPLEKYLQELRNVPRETAQLRRLGADEWLWMDAGAEIAAAFWLLAEGKGEGNLRLQQAVGKFPPEIQPALLGAETR